MPVKVAIVGAQGTGKTALLLALQATSMSAMAPHDFLVEEARPLVHALENGLPQADATSVHEAVALHRLYDMTLLMGLDLPMPPTQQQADGDTWLRNTLNVHGLPYTVVYGNAQARTASALQAIAHHIKSRDPAQRRRKRDSAEPAWQWHCDTCSDAACEHRLFSAFLDPREPAARAR